jgi:hypothetical protein
MSKICYKWQACNCQELPWENPLFFFLLVEVGGDPVHYVPSLSQRPVYIYLCLDQCIFQALMLSLRDFQGWLYKSAGQSRVLAFILELH